MTIGDECDVAFRSDTAPTVSNESDKMAAAAKKGEQRRGFRMDVLRATKAIYGEAMWEDGERGRQIVGGGMWNTKSYMIYTCSWKRK